MTEQQHTPGPELVTLHLYRDTCAGGYFIAARELDRTLHQHVQELVIRRDQLPAPKPPTREQIADRLIERLRNSGGWPIDEVWQRWQNLFREYDCDLAMIRNGAGR